MTANQNLGPQSQLTELRSATLGLIGGLAGAIGCVWLIWALYPDITGIGRPAASIIAGGILALGGWTSFALRRWSSRVAVALLVGSIVLSGATAIAAYQMVELGYVLAIPVVITGALMARRGVWLITALSCVAFTWAYAVELQRPLWAKDYVVPLCGMVLIAGATWLSARNLYIALEWTWYHYEKASENERLALQRQGELRQALKALDEATYRVERANHMLSAAREQAEDARRLKQQFAQTISHELRTPLNLIVGFTELMSNAPDYYGGQLTPAYQRDLNVVYRNARHLQTLVNDVLDLARIEAAQMSLIFETVAPADLVEDVLATARSMIEMRHLSLLRDVAPGLPYLKLDPIRIRQVLLNLLSNAVRFTERGAITVSVRHAGDDVVFSVADTGIGMPPDKLAVIFEEFRQGDGGLQRAHEGTGLGLAISRGFVELHGGRIWADSRPGEGSTFHFSLPVPQVDKDAAGSAHGDRNQPPPHAVHHRRGEDLLLAVSTSPTTSAMLGRYLHNSRVLTVMDLDQAQQAAKANFPQCVIIDTNDRGIDAQALQDLAQQWSMRQLTFLACPLPGEPALRRQLNVAAYMTKPVSQQSLWDVLRQFGSRVNRVLVVDDDRDFVRLLSRMLDSPLRRYQLIGAYSGQEGLDMIRFHLPDLVLLDMVLPDMRGERVIEQLRSSPSLRDIPIVVISAQDQAEAPRILPGAAMIAKQDGLSAAELVRVIRALTAAPGAVSADPSQPMPSAAPVR